ncbi:MAG TPA: septum formation initiator family protein [Gemmatimonadota bacterium]|nr:septum formation initiator family protein [Gemmatimonadota bacterium]
MRERLKRWGFRAFAGLLVGVGAYYATFGGVYSAFDIRAMEHDREVLQDSVFRLETVTDSLVQRGDSLVVDPVAIERVAREEHGYLRDGELRVRFLPGQAAPPAEPSSAPGVDQ